MQADVTDLLNSHWQLGYFQSHDRVIILRARVSII